MARPVKTSLDYFPMNCYDNESLKIVEAKFGLCGYAIIIKIYQKIFGTNGYYCDWNEDSEALFAKETGVSCEEIRLILADAMKRGIFNEGMYNEYSVLTSSDIQGIYVEAVNKRTKVNMRSDIFLLNAEEMPRYIFIDGANSDSEHVFGEKTPVYGEKTPVFSTESTQSKVKEIKGNKRKENKTRVKERESNDAALPDAPPSYDDVVSYAEKNRYRNIDLEKFYRYFITKGRNVSDWRYLLDECASGNEGGFLLG